jgi:4-amino-4-deoxy-L-arabinose transferase-like glycosyltransferase
MRTEPNVRSDGYQWPDVLILALGCVLVFYAVGDRALWGSEGRWAEVTREMMLSGDYFHPTINGEPYFDKPLVTYWLIAAISFVTGRLDELICRLPSAIAGLVALWATLRLGRLLWSASVGRLAACILLTSYGLIYQSRMAAADTENLAAITLAVLWYWSRRDKLNFATFLVLYLIALVGSLTKGPVAAAVVGAALLPDIVMAGRWKAFLRPASLLALAIGLAVYFVPFFWAAKTNPSSYHSSGLALVWQENFMRFFEPTDHRNPIYTYLWSVPMLILPWAPLFIAALFVAIRSWKKLDSDTRWLLMAIAMVFLFFTASGSRRNYYILPILPFCAIFTAVIFTRLGSLSSPRIVTVGFDIQKWLLFAAAGVELVVALVFPFVPKEKGLGPLAGTAIISIIIAFAALAAALAASQLAKRWAEGPEEKAFAPLAAVALVVMGGFFCLQQNSIDELRTERPFLRELRAKTADIPADRIGLFQEIDAKVIYYLGRDKPVSALAYNEKELDAKAAAKKRQDLEAFFADSRPGVFITQARCMQQLPAEFAGRLAPAPDLQEPMQALEKKSEGSKKWVAWFMPAAPAREPSRSNEEKARP